MSKIRNFGDEACEQCTFVLCCLGSFGGGLDELRRGLVVLRVQIRILVVSCLDRVVLGAFEELVGGLGEGGDLARRALALGIGEGGVVKRHVMHALNVGLQHVLVRELARAGLHRAGKQTRSVVLAL